MKNTILFALLALVLLTACAPQVADAAVPASTATLTPTATVLLTATATPTPTASPTPTATATPAVISLPVRNGTPVPNLPYEVITAENVHRLREVARYGYPRLLEGHPYRLTADGKTIVVGTTAGIEFYDAGTQRKTGGFEVDFLRSFDVTPDGRFVLTLAGESLMVWTAEGEKVREFDVQAGDAWALNAVALSPDGSMLAVQRPRGQVVEADKLDVYRVSDGSLLDTVRGTGALFSPDGKYLATAFDGSIRLYPAGELGQGWEKRLPKQSLPWCARVDTCGLTFSPDGTLAAVVSKARVDVYQVETRRLVRQVSGWSGDDLPSVLFSLDGSQVMIETMPIWQGMEIQTPARVIVVDVSSGKWLVDEEAPDGFVWFDGTSAQAFTWKAEGEMPYYLNLLISSSGNATSWVRTDHGTIQCLNADCETIFNPEKEIVVGRDGKLYNLAYSDDEKRWNVLDSENSIVVSFPGKKDLYFDIDVYENVAIVTSFSGYTIWTSVYRNDGKRAEIGESTAIAFDDNLIVFNAYREGTKVLDIQDWTIKKFINRCIGVRSGNLVCIENSWQTVPMIHLVNISTKETLSLEIPHWNSEFLGKGVMSASKVLFVYSGGGIYVFDVRGFIQKIIPSASVFSSDMSLSKDDRFLALFTGDGFIRVWAVVPEDAPVR